MSNISFRFGRGTGLERSPARQIQTGNLQFEEIDGEVRDVIQKRRGSVEVGLGLDVGSINPESPHAVWYRTDELAVEADGVLYARPECDTGADLVERGPWTRARLRESVGQVSESEMRTAARGVIGGCALEAVEVVGQGILARVIGDGIAAEFVVDADGTDCKIVVLDATRLVLTWVRGEGSGPVSIQRALWSPGDTSVAPVVVADNAALDGIGEQAWDVHADHTVGLVVWAWFSSPLERRVATEEANGVTFGFSGQA